MRPHPARGPAAPVAGARPASPDREGAGGVMGLSRKAGSGSRPTGAGGRDPLSSARSAAEPGRPAYRYLDDVALADIAFEAEGEDLGSLFEACALATTAVMADPATVRPTLSRHMALDAETLEALLYDFLAEIVWVKDAEGLLFSRFTVTVEADGRPRLSAALWGQPIRAGGAALRADVKAVTYHLFALERTAAGWRARVVLDI